MSRLRAVIVDDEALSRRAMRQLLDRRDDVEVVGEYGDAVELDPSALAADVVFLDIEMPQRSGMDVARAWPADGASLVFVTAFEGYAPSAFDTEAIDYLTKPVSGERLERAIDRVRRARELRVVSSASTGTRPAVRLVVRTGDRESFLATESVEAIEADGVYAVVYALGRKQLIRRSLEALEQELPAPAFLRVHRSWIVRVAAVLRLERDRESRAPVLRLTSGVVVPVSRRRAAAVTRVLRGGGG